MPFLCIFRKQRHDAASNPCELRVEQAKGLSRDELSALIAAHDAALGTGEGVLKDGRRTAVSRVRHGDAEFSAGQCIHVGLRVPGLSIDVTDQPQRLFDSRREEDRIVGIHNRTRPAVGQDIHEGKAG